MKIVGFAISKDELWYSVLEGDNKSNAHIIVCGKHNFQSESNIADLMITFKNLFALYALFNWCFSFNLWRKWN